MLSMYQQITVKTLKKQGEAIQDIASSLHCHRNTVRNILCRESITDKQTRERSSYFSSYKDIITPLLNSDISKFRIWEILRDEHGSTKSYIALCSYIRREFPKQPKAFVVQHSLPGEEAEVDFGYLGKIKTVDGRMRKVWGFVMVLAYSRIAFYGIAFDQSVATFIALHMAAFTYFGGVPKRIKYDNLKSAVLKNNRYDLQLNEEFLRFAGYYNFVIAPCTPYQPQQKGKVESGIGYLEGNFWAGRTFADEHDCQRQLTVWMNTIANTRVHGTTKLIPADVFAAEEKQTLLVLPQEPFVFFHSVLRLVKPNCHVNFQNNYYSVPHQYVGKTVEVRWQENIVTMYADGGEIARHVITPLTGTYITVASHYPPEKVYSQTTYQEKHEEKMKAIGPFSHEFFRRCVVQDAKGWVKTIRRILGLVPVYGNETVDCAVSRALAYGAIRSSVVRSICEKHLEHSPIEPFLLSRFPAADVVTAEQDRSSKVSDDTNHKKEKEEEKNGMSRDLSYYASLTEMIEIDMDMKDMKEAGGTVSVQEDIGAASPMHQSTL